MLTRFTQMFRNWWMYLVRGLFGPTSLGHRELAMQFLGEYLAIHYSGKKAVVLSNPFSTQRGQPREVYQYEKAGLRGLRQPKVLVIMVTGYPTVDTATSAIKEGAYDFLVKPVDVNQLDAVMHRALSTIELRSNLSTMRGMNVALYLSIPFWILVGILVKVFLFR